MRGLLFFLLLERIHKGFSIFYSRFNARLHIGVSRLQPKQRARKRSQAWAASSRSDSRTTMTYAKRTSLICSKLFFISKYFCFLELQRRSSLFRPIAVASECNHPKQLWSYLSRSRHFSRKLLSASPIQRARETLTYRVGATDVKTFRLRDPLNTSYIHCFQLTVSQRLEKSAQHVLRHLATLPLLSPFPQLLPPRP